MAQVFNHYDDDLNRDERWLTHTNVNHECSTNRNKKKRLKKLTVDKIHAMHVRV